MICVVIIAILVKHFNTKFGRRGNRMKMKQSYHIYAAVTIVFWSMAYVLTRLVLQHFSPYSLGFLRYFVASLALGMVVIIAKIKPPKKKDLLSFIASGAVGFFLYMVFYNTGMQTVSAATSSVVIATVPVVTSLLARTVYKERQSRIQWLAIGIELIGVIVLTMAGGVFSVKIGLLWLFLAVLALSAYNLLQRKLTQKYSGLQTAAYSIFFGTVLLCVFLPRSANEVVTAPGIYLVCIVLLGVFSSALAYAY